MMWPVGGSFSAGDVCHGLSAYVMGLCDKCVMYLLHDVACQWFSQCCRCVSWICLLACHGFV